MDGYPIHMHKFSQISYVDRVHGSRSDNLNGGKPTAQCHQQSQNLQML